MTSVANTSRDRGWRNHDCWTEPHGGGKRRLPVRRWSLPHRSVSPDSSPRDETATPRSSRDPKQRRTPGRAWRTSNHDRCSFATSSSYCPASNCVSIGKTLVPLSGSAHADVRRRCVSNVEGLVRAESSEVRNCSIRSLPKTSTRDTFHSASFYSQRVRTVSVPRKDHVIPIRVLFVLQRRLLRRHKYAGSRNSTINYEILRPG